MGCAVPVRLRGFKRGRSSSACRLHRGRLRAHSALNFMVQSSIYEYAPRKLQSLSASSCTSTPTLGCCPIASQLLALNGALRFTLLFPLIIMIHGSFHVTAGTGACSGVDFGALAAITQSTLLSESTLGDICTSPCYAQISVRFPDIKYSDWY